MLIGLTDADIDFITIRDAIDDHYCLKCKEPYAAWRGVPQMDKRLSKYCEHLERELYFLLSWRLRVAELGPGGGRWTQLFFSLMNKNGWPIETIYNLVGTTAEHQLTFRDAIRPQFQLPITLNSMKRIPSKSVTRNNHLISELRINTIESPWLLARDKQGNPFTPRLDLVLAFDSIKYLSAARRLNCFRSISQCITGGGLVYCNIKHIDSFEFETMVTSTGFTQAFAPIHNLRDNSVYYVLVRN